MLLLLACTEASEPPDDLPTLGETVVEVPAAGLPVEPNAANNNLDVDVGRREVRVRRPTACRRPEGTPR